MYGTVPASTIPRADRPETAADRLEQKQKAERKARRAAQRARARFVLMILHPVVGADLNPAARTPRRPNKLLSPTPAHSRS